MTTDRRRRRPPRRWLRFRRARWTDKQGKQWLYRKSGTGYTRTVAPAIPIHNLQIPKDAVKNSDGTYDWTDKGGQKWKFAYTPFGLVKNPIDAPATHPAPPDTTTRVIDKGDTVRFERPSPFGVSGYDKKKSELNDDERRLYEASKTKPE
jgi:hypothetical protein